jgi:PTH1 family peptidyl-tRNA hydrolase
MSKDSNPQRIRLIAGLGNPGTDYAATRHNAGAWFVDAVCRQQGVWLAADKGFAGETARFRTPNGEVFLLVPSTYMNRSGQSVGALAKFYKIAPEEILVVHDELDLLPGAVKLKQGGGNAGHNGLKDITAHLGTPDFWRLRLGIGHPRTLQLTQSVSDFVLHRPRAEEQSAIDGCIAKGLKALPLMLGGDMPAAMRQVHAPDKQESP